MYLFLPADCEPHVSCNFVCFIAHGVADSGQEQWEGVCLPLCVYDRGSPWKADGILGTSVGSWISKGSESVPQASPSTKHNCIRSRKHLMAVASSIQSPRCLHCRLWHSERGKTQLTRVWCHLKCDFLTFKCYQWQVLLLFNALCPSCPLLCLVWHLVPQCPGMGPFTSTSLGSVSVNQGSFPPRGPSLLALPALHPERQPEVSMAAWTAAPCFSNYFFLRQALSHLVVWSSCCSSETLLHPFW